VTAVLLAFFTLLYSLELFQ